MLIDVDTVVEILPNETLQRAGHGEKPMYRKIGDNTFRSIYMPTPCPHDTCASPVKISETLHSLIENWIIPVLNKTQLNLGGQISSISYAEIAYRWYLDVGKVVCSDIKPTTEAYVRVSSPPPSCTWKRHYSTSPMARSTTWPMWRDVTDHGSTGLPAYLLAVIIIALLLTVGLAVGTIYIGISCCEKKREENRQRDVDPSATTYDLRMTSVSIPGQPLPVYALSLTPANHSLQSYEEHNLPPPYEETA